ATLAVIVCVDSRDIGQKADTDDIIGDAGGLRRACRSKQHACRPCECVRLVHHSLLCILTLRTVPAARALWPIAGSALVDAGQGPTLPGCCNFFPAPRLSDAQIPVDLRRVFA